MARVGTFEELLGGADAGVADLCRRLRALVLEVHPDAVEVVRLGDRAATYGVGPKKMTEGYAYVMPQGGHVNLGFYQGATLADPHGLLEGTGKAMRHVKVRSPADLERPALRALVAAAVAERRAALSE
jgi:hypothetical protein